MGDRLAAYEGSSAVRALHPPLPLDLAADYARLGRPDAARTHLRRARGAARTLADDSYGDGVRAAVRRMEIRLGEGGAPGGWRPPGRRPWALPSHPRRPPGGRAARRHGGSCASEAESFGERAPRGPARRARGSAGPGPGTGCPGVGVRCVERGAPARGSSQERARRRAADGGAATGPGAFVGADAVRGGPDQRP